MVYFIQCTVTGRVKIGKANDPLLRLRDLQIGSPTPLRILAVFDGEEDEERSLHQRFTKARIHGEWFELSEGMAGFLADRGIKADAPDLAESMRSALEGFEQYRDTILDVRSQWARLLKGRDPHPLERRFREAVDAWADLVNRIHLIALDRWTAREYRHTRDTDPFYVSGGLWEDHKKALAALLPLEERAGERMEARMIKIAEADWEPDPPPTPACPALAAG